MSEALARARPAMAEIRLSQSDFDRFARLSRDDNPIHCDPEFAARSRFGATVAHGMLLYGHLARVLAEALPDAGFVACEQELMFVAPSYAEELLRFRVTPRECLPDGSVVFDMGVDKPGAPGVTAVAGRARVCPAGACAAWPVADGGSGTGGGDAFFGLGLGQQASAARSFSAADLVEYADLVGDCGSRPDTASADSAGLSGALVPPPLLAGMFSDLLGTRLPGRGTGWMKQRMSFLRPAHVDEPLTARVSICRLRPDKALVNLRTSLFGADGRPVVDGEALVLVRDLDDKVGIKGDR